MKKLIGIILALGLVLTGCQLATGEVSDEGTVNQDKLVGYVVTTEHLDLFDMESYLEDHLNEIMDGVEITGDTSAYQGRLYAQEVVEKSTTEDGVPCTTIYYNFDHVDGIALLDYEAETILENGEVLSYFNCGTCDEGFFEVAYRSNSTDAGTDNYCEGTIYFPDDAEEIYTCMNPVFQDSEGRLYLTAGHSFHTTANGTYSQNLTEEYTSTENGVETVDKTEFKMTVKTVHVPEKVAIVQMSGDNQILDRQEYIPGELPEELTPVEGCAYILVEEYAGQEVHRQMLEPGGEDITVFTRSEEPWCTADGTRILWPEA